MNIIKKIFGTSNTRTLKKMQRTVTAINGYEEQFAALSDAELKAKTDEFAKRAAEGESLDKILPEAFAAVREASKRTLKLRHFDVQMIGGMVLHQGNISEMRTGEGKTLVATMPIFLNALCIVLFIRQETAEVVEENPCMRFIDRCFVYVLVQLYPFCRMNKSANA